MFNLMIQATQGPEHKFTFWREIACGVQLVFKPSAFHVSFLIGQRKISLRHNVRRLKDN